MLTLQCVCSYCVGPPDTWHIASVLSSYQEEFTAPFVKWADSILRRPDNILHRAVEVTVGEDGFPVMPLVNMNDISSSKCVAIVLNFLELAWRMFNFMAVVMKHTDICRRGCLHGKRGSQ
jgi:hypothetical protein